MNAIRYRWDGTRYRFIVEVIAEQPDGTAAMHLISKHETAADAADAAQKLRQERDNTNTELDRALDGALRATNAALAERVQALEAALDKAADDVAFLRNRLDIQAEQDAAALRDAQDDAARLREALDAENAALKAERDDLLETLADVTNQACRMDDGILDSMALSANAGAMRVLAEHGVIVIDEEYGRRVIGHYPEVKA